MCYQTAGGGDDTPPLDPHRAERWTEAESGGLNVAQKSSDKRENVDEQADDQLETSTNGQKPLKEYPSAHIHKEVCVVCAALVHVHQ